MLEFLGKKRKRQLLRSLSSDPLSEGHPVYKDKFLCLRKGWQRVSEGFAQGWRRVGQTVGGFPLHPPILQFPKDPLRRAGL